MEVSYAKIIPQAASLKYHPERVRRGPSRASNSSTCHNRGSPVIPTTAVPSNPGECAYQWAYQDLPELSNRFQTSIRALQPEAQANAFAFGENCVRADGSSTFTPMETDFNVTLQVSDLTDESALGEWVVKVMEVITAIPSEQIIGPRPGRVSLIFRSGSKQQGINFYINEFQELPSGLSNAEIFQALQTSQ